LSLEHLHCAAENKPMGKRGHLIQPLAKAACYQQTPENTTVSTMIPPFGKPLDHRKPKTTEHEATFLLKIKNASNLDPLPPSL